MPLRVWPLKVAFQIITVLNPKDGIARVNDFGRKDKENLDLKHIILFELLLKCAFEKQRAELLHV